MPEATPLPATTTVVVDRFTTVTDRSVEMAVRGWLAGYSNALTRATYARSVKRLMTWTGEQGLGLFDLKRPHVDLWVRTLEADGYDPTTIGRHLGACRVFFTYAVDEEYLDRNPATRVKAPRIAEKPQPYLKNIAVQRFLEAAERLGTRDHALACLLLFNGLRVSEACSIRIEEMTEDRGLRALRFIGKGSKAAQVPLAPTAAYAVDKLIAGRSSGPLFVRRDGHQLDRTTAHRWVRRIAREAGIDERCSPHALRRSAITSLLDRGVPVRDVQAFARHSDPRTTSRYDQARFGMERNATFALQAMFS